jgi:hypothetical protein
MSMEVLEVWGIADNSLKSSGRFLLADSLRLPSNFNFTSLLHSPQTTSLPSNFSFIASFLTFGNFDRDLLHEPVIGPTVGVFHARLDLPVAVLQLDCSLNSENREKRVE